jgi:hypothetical protein
LACNAIGYRSVDADRTRHSAVREVRRGGEEVTERSARNSFRAMASFVPGPLDLPLHCFVVDANKRSAVLAGVAPCQPRGDGVPRSGGKPHLCDNAHRRVGYRIPSAARRFDCAVFARANDMIERTLVGFRIGALDLGRRPLPPASCAILKPGRVGFRELSNEPTLPPSVQPRCKRFWWCKNVRIRA